CKFGCACNLGMGGRKCAWDGGQPPCENTATSVSPTCAPGFFMPRPLPAPPVPPAPTKKAADASQEQGVQPVEFQAQGVGDQQLVGYYYYLSPEGNNYYFVPVYSQGQ